MAVRRFFGIWAALAGAGISAAAGAGSGPAPDAGAAAPAGYTLVWADEFSRDGAPDPANWDCERGFVRNGEAQWYQSDNARVRGGVLVIEGKRAHWPSPVFGDPAVKPEFRGRKFINFTSASLTTRGRHSWLYGRFEIRARITAEQGLWPALWFVGDDGRWPAGGEIDLMEFYQGTILGNFAWASAGGKAAWKSAKVPLSAITRDPDWDKRFHTWVMDWDRRQISLSLDGRLINTLNLDNVHNGGDPAGENPFRKPQRLIMNLALGGKNGGPLKDTRFPARFEIDYVRVYQKAKP